MLEHRLEAHATHGQDGRATNSATTHGTRSKMPILAVYGHIGCVKMLDIAKKDARKCPVSSKNSGFCLPNADIITEMG